MQKKIIVTLAFEKNTNFYRRKLAKIAENCHPNMDPSQPIGCTAIRSDFSVTVSLEYFYVTVTMLS
jgi:hypothetical protein